MRSSALVVTEYEKIYKDDAIDDKEFGATFPIPRFPGDILIALCQEATENFKKQPLMHTISSPVYIIGDLHGNIRDLVRILKSLPALTDTKYLFLGDYVDRGEFSVEVATLVLALSLQYPNNVFLIRGNHEFRTVNMDYGFYGQVTNAYGSSDVYDAFNIAFAWMPIAALINGSTLCVHGGISPYLTKLEQLLQFKRPLDDCKDKLLADIMWSDPSHSVETYGPSNRGNGVCFGRVALRSFLEENKLKRLIRAHEYVKDGIEQFWGNLCLTVFTSSNYRRENNDPGLIFINERDEVTGFKVPPTEILSRARATFFNPLANKIRSRNSHSAFGYVNIASGIKPILPTLRKQASGSPMLSVNSQLIGRYKVQRRRRASCNYVEENIALIEAGTVPSVLASPVPVIHRSIGNLTSMISSIPRDF